jgi:uncharacterized protein YqjF (DUF2071 family)
MLVMSGREPEERVQSPLVEQAWRRLTFLHWPTDVDAVARLLPDDLEPDLVDGNAWVAITPFEVRRFRPLGRKSISVLPPFSETNVRTYVRHRNGKDGIRFLSLDVDSTLNVIGGRLIGTPYFRSTMSVTGDGTIRYRCRRLASGASHDITVRPGVPIEPDRTIDQLTGRWRAFTSVADHTLELPVEHPPWLLRTAEVISLDETLIAAIGLPTPATPPIAHYSHGVDARLGPPRSSRKD